MWHMQRQQLYVLHGTTHSSKLNEKDFIYLRSLKD